MKRWLMVLFFLSFVSASVDVSNYSVNSGYVSFDEIKGSVNLTISGESYEELITFSNGESVQLGKFLDDNNANFSCSPVDCDMTYNFSSNETEKTIAISNFETEYFGFVLYGEDVSLGALSFKVTSDFASENQRPLTIEFFEDEEWSFSEFSDEFSYKKWGYFDPLNKEVGSKIGPLLSFCEEIAITDTSKLRVGADVNITQYDVGDLKMSVYSDYGDGDCSFDPRTEEWCDIFPVDEMFLAGNYHVCVTADVLLEYDIYIDRVGESCGSITKDNGVSFVDKEYDYGIFVQNVKYADAVNGMGIKDSADMGVDVDVADYIILNEYESDCSNGCILPLKATGVDQNLRIYDVSLVYIDKNGYPPNNTFVYDLDRSAAKVYFDGTLDLGLLEFEVLKTDIYYASLAGKDLFRKNINVVAAPIVSSVLPANAPAGVPVRFYAAVDFDNNKSLSYSWKFGDNKTEVTSVPYVTHAYSDIRTYTLSVEVSAGGNASSKNSFVIDVISPESAVGIGLAARRDSLKNVRSLAEGLSEWYINDLLGLLGVLKFELELDVLEEERDESVGPTEFRDIVVKIYDMDIPVTIRINKFENPYLLSELGDVNVEAVSAASGEVSGGTSGEYAGSILGWQNENIVVLIESNEIMVSYWSGNDANVLTSYRVEVTNNWNEVSYFVINKPLGELHFKGSAGAVDAAGSTAIALDPGKKKVFEFYYEGSDRGSFFVSPKLSSILIESDISTNCNFNKVCEEGLGEDYDNCRSDCKPIEKAVLFFVLGLFVFLFFYTILQVWYKKRYEGYLFKDRAQLYNLLMFVANARAGNMSDGDIAKGLGKQGWSDEKVKYIVRKSLGKSVGMIEIIPITMISAWFRNRKAKARVNTPVAGTQTPVGAARPPVGSPY